MPRKTVSKAKSKRRRKAGPTTRVPAPPAKEGTKILNVNIPESLSWRMHVAIFQLSCEGEKVTKRSFVVEAITEALDEFDRTRR